MSDDLTFISVQLPVQDDVALKIIAATLRVTRSELIRQALEEKISQYPEIVKMGENVGIRKEIPVVYVARGAQHE